MDLFGGEQLEVTKRLNAGHQLGFLISSRRCPLIVKSFESKWSLAITIWTPYYGASSICFIDDHQRLLSDASQGLILSSAITDRASLKACPSIILIKRLQLRTLKLEFELRKFKLEFHWQGMPTNGLHLNRMFVTAASFNYNGTSSCFTRAQ